MRIMVLNFFVKMFPVDYLNQKLVLLMTSTIKTKALN